MNVHLNGRLMPIAEAKISPLDRGFLFGDGVYEVIPVYSRHPFRFDEHLRRLQNSLDGIRLPNPHSNDEWKAIIAEVMAASPHDDQSVYLQVSRGADVKRDHPFPQGVAPTVFIMSQPLVTPSAALLASGGSAITAEDFRWLRCDLKTTALLANVLIRQMAVDAGVTETILLRDGELTEASASNVFIVSNGVLLAPPKDHRVLPGITYDVVIELAQANGQALEVRPVSEAELRGAEELWVTSSTKEVLPIVTLDGKPVGDGRPGPVFARMHAWYQDYKQRVMRAG